MKDKVIKIVGNKLDSLNVFIDDVYEEKKGNIKTTRNIHIYILCR